MTKNKVEVVPKWKNRIVAHGEEAPDQLLANPSNWRIHPKAQQDALGGVLAEVGIVDTVLVNQRTGFVVDGHLRVAMAISAGQKTIPVTYVDLSEEEEALILATLDPIGALAVADKEQLDALLQEIETDNEGLNTLLADLVAQTTIWQPETDLPTGEGETAFRVIITFRNRAEETEFWARLGRAAPPVNRVLFRWGEINDRVV